VVGDGHALVRMVQTGCRKGDGEEDWGALVGGVEVEASLDCDHGVRNQTTWTIADVPGTYRTRHSSLRCTSPLPMSGLQGFNKSVLAPSCRRGGRVSVVQVKVNYDLFFLQRPLPSPTLPQHLYTPSSISPIHRISRIGDARHSPWQ